MLTMLLIMLPYCTILRSTWCLNWGGQTQMLLAVQRRIKEIADKVSDWPRRWEREQRLRQRPQVFWKINSEAVV